MQDNSAAETSPPSQALAKGRNAISVRWCGLLRCFDFQRHQHAVLLQDKIHFAPRPVAPEIESAPGRVKGAPGLQGLENRLLQPVALVETIGQVGGALDASQPGRQTAVAPQNLLSFHEASRGIGRVGGKPDQQAAVAQLRQYVQSIRNAYQLIMARGGRQTVFNAKQAEELVNGNMPLSTLLAAGKAMEKEAVVVKSATGQAMQEVTGGGRVAPTGGNEPPPEAVQQLQSDPSPTMQGHFDEVFGPGAAKKALGQ